MMESTEESDDADSQNSQSVKLERHSLELNLDYLERRDVCFSPCSPVSPVSLPQSPDTPELVKLVLLGAPGVGKTSIIQFVWNNFVADYSPTDARHTYYPTVIMNRRVYELKIMDQPALPYFPVSSVYELAVADRQSPSTAGLRDATAYMLVMDVSDLDTFRYLESVRDQIAESRDIGAVPFLVVGNKVDLFDPEDEAMVAGRRAVMDKVRAEWRCGYAECSARYGSQVCQVFRQLITAVDECEVAANAHEIACPSLLGLHDPAKCRIL